MVNQAVIEAVVTIVLYTILALLILVPLAFAFVYLVVDEHKKARQRRKIDQTTVRELFFPKQAADEVRSQLEAHFDKAEQQLKNGAANAKDQIINILEDA